MINTQTVLAAAGRRIDDAHFPKGNETEVAKAVRSALNDHRPALIVASAACGADILVLEAARDLRIPTRIVLPFSVRAFRERSVENCEGNWASRYDALLIDRRREDGSLLLLATRDPASDEEATAAYHQVTDRLIEEVGESVRRDKGAKGGALVVWDGVRKDENDESGYFLDRARAQRFRIIEVSTLGSG